MTRIYRTCVSFPRTRVSRHPLRPPEAWGRRRGAHGNVARCIIPCSLSVLIRSAKSTILDSAQEVWRMQGGLVICKAARAHILTSRYRGTSTRLRKPRLMAQQHHHAGHARIQDPMVHKRSCLHRLGSNAGPVEPGVLDPVPICLCISRGAAARRSKFFLFSRFGHRSLGTATQLSFESRRSLCSAQQSFWGTAQRCTLIGCEGQTVGHTRLDQVTISRFRWRNRSQGIIHTSL